MIGITTIETEKETVREFFELFKVPWEYYDESKFYDVVISTVDFLPSYNAKVVIIYSSNKIPWDNINRIEVQNKRSGELLEYNQKQLPIYGEVSNIRGKGKQLIGINGTNEFAGLKIISKNVTAFRFGYDLFYEIRFLLKIGQPSKSAHVPTLELHISIIRELILACGIPLIEIPPVPAGYKFITCLTHDVDFIRIKNHKFNHTVFGFVYRAFIGSIVNFLKKKSSWQKLIKNWISVLKLPGVYLGIVDDYFDQFHRYREIENELSSTFFFIPFKNYAGRNENANAPQKRSSKYDVEDISAEVANLIALGCEVGLHGIDAWLDASRGREELERISNITKDGAIGNRIHWLYFNEHSIKMLEKAGFIYDSTFGYNDAVGYRAGTPQVFLPPGGKRLLELPLLIQDTALFYSGRMNLSEESAWKQIDILLEDALQMGGALTINWHNRSLGPERLWDKFYIKLLEELKKLNCWISNAGNAVKWYSKRRSVFFKAIEFDGECMRLKLGGYRTDDLPDLLVRVYKPNPTVIDPNSPTNSDSTYIDIPLKSRAEVSISLQDFTDNGPRRN